MEIKNSYQEVPLPDGSILPGFSPSIRRYNEITTGGVSFKGKTLLDLGCCQCSFGIQALRDGAVWVSGIDNDPERLQQSRYLLNQWNFGLKTSLHQGNLNKITSYRKHDIVLISVVLHWLDNAENVIKIAWEACNEFLVIFYRYPQEQEESGYRPTLDELSELINTKPFFSKFVSETTDQNIMMVIYDKSY